MESINIKGKDYIPVNERIKEFWRRYPDGNIITEMVSNDDGVCVFKATTYTDGAIRTTGYACEKESSSFINKTSYIENCETSAVGRALGILGIGIDTSIASAEEVDNAIYQQETKIDKTKVQALAKAITNAELSDAVVKGVLKEFGYKELEEIRIADYMGVVKAFQDIKEAK